MWAQLAVWAVVGLGLASLHLWLLHRAVEHSRNLGPKVAKHHIVRGIWLRIVLWLPALVPAAMLGIWACLGLILGSLVGRWVAYKRVAALGPVTAHHQGHQRGY